MKKVIIIGNGIAGVTAARHIRKMSNYEITIISDESPYFYARTALMYVFMGKMSLAQTQPYEPDFWSKNNINLLQGCVNQILPQQKKLLVTINQRTQSIHYDQLILATGSQYKTLPEIPEDAIGVQGLYSIQDLEAIDTLTQRVQSAVIIGGGLIGVEMAEMFMARQIQVTMLIREPYFWGNTLPPEEASFVTEYLRQKGVQVITGNTLKELILNEKKQVIGITTHQNQSIDCQFVGLAIGVTPNITLAKGLLETNKGVLVNNFLETSEADIFAIGDCAELRNVPSGRKATEAIWYTGRLMGKTLAYTICQQPQPYQPPVFYNSAKFFGLEYQVYGRVAPFQDEGIAQFYWKNPHKNQCIRIQYSHDYQVLGIHAIGLRLRQAVCENWIQTQKSLSFVLCNWEKANFDTEFSPSYYQALIAQYNIRFPHQAIAVPKTFRQWLGKMLSI